MSAASASAPVAPFETQGPRVLVNGISLDQSWAQRMLSLSIEMRLQLPTRLTMRFLSPGLGDDTTEFPFSFGRHVKVEFPVQGSTTFEMVCGLLHVTEIGAERDRGTGELVVVAHDGSFWLGQKQKVTTFAEMTISDVARQVASDAGLRAGDIEATSEIIPYLMQTDTAAGFISTLARRVGYDWWVDDDKFNFKKAGSQDTVTVHLSGEVVRMSVSQQAVATMKVAVTGWDRDGKAKVTGDADLQAPLENEIPGTNRSYLSEGVTHTTSSLRAESSAEANKLAKSIGDRYRSAAVQVQGEVYGNPGIIPRTTVEVVGEYLGGSYEVVQAEHRYGPEGYFTRFTGGDRVPTGLADFIGGPNLPEHFGAYGGLPPLIPAVVTAIGTEENLGRVQVRFPYLSEDNTSHWARVLSMGGGTDRGFLFLPEVDDEVLVAFEGGDTRFPVVMGGLYSKVYSTEEQLVKNGQINSRSVRSRLGHYMDFFDGTDDKTRHIALGLGSGGKPGTDYRLRIGEDRFDIEVPEGKPISIKAGKAQITFTDSSSIEVKADNISIKAESDVAIEGKNIKLKGQVGVELSQGPNKVALASAGVDIKGVPQANIKGGPKVNIG